MIRPCRILVLAPHPDDEIVACGIAAMRARAAGARVFVLYLTTGVAEREALWAWQRPRCAVRVQRRRDEAIEAAGLLGLEPVAFRDTPARRLRFDLAAAEAALAAAIAECRAEALWVPAFEGGHQDHDAANALAAGFAGRLPVWEFAAYNFAGGRVRANRFAGERGGEVTIEANAAEAQAKRWALGCYASECDNLRHLGAARETGRPLPAHDYARPPHPGRLFRERFHWVPFRHPRVDFAASAEVYRDIADWASGARPHPLGDRPGGESGQADRELARAFDEPERQRRLGREAGERGEGDQRGLLGAPAGGDQEGGAARGKAQAFEQGGLGKTG
ncbi:MAG TPA: PIG-L family deacetylase [Stellaceae bacterium]|nr:PIG-L family deacetylase [Stellaceae bacterium]